MNTKSLRQILLILFLVILIIPTFWRLSKFGFYTTHDFHPFRAFEFHKCIKDLQIPCRWAPDSAYEYGEPMFNFYGQLSYFVTEPIHLIHFSIINSVKIAFIISLVGSAITMFFFSKQLWRSNLAGSISAIFYLYAPYRAVDVWVRGALPEALAFIFYPAILYFLNKFFDSENLRDLLIFSFLTAILLMMHNLSFLMFLLPLSVWTIYQLLKTKKFYLIKNLMGAGILTLLLSAFYLLPVVAESKLVNINSTLEGYYNYKYHFANLNQLLFSRIWGYGASEAGFNDHLSFAVGQLHWTLPLLLIILILVSRKIRENLKFLVLAGIGWLALFLVHQRSIFIWEVLTPLQYLQFPWRFLSIAVFAFSASVGAVVLFLKNKVAQYLVVTAIIIVVIFTNVNFFHEDVWWPISDEEQFSGGPWIKLTTFAINDYWPKYGKKIPDKIPSDRVIFLQGKGNILSFAKTSNTVKAKIEATDSAKVQLASVYFPGWIGFVDSQKTQVEPSGELGLSTLSIPAGTHEILLRFTDTPVRIIGNILTLIGVGIVITFLIKRHQNVRKRD